jgi:hypothetical protein
MENGNGKKNEMRRIDRKNKREGKNIKLRNMIE